jgi:hypothetical protein
MDDPEWLEGYCKHIDDQLDTYAIRP